MEKFPRFSEKFRQAPFYAILDTGYVPREKLADKCGQLIEGGAKIVQLRAKKETSCQRRQIALSLLPMFRAKNAPIFVINDDLELAASLDGPNIGLHIGQDDIPPYKARMQLGYDKALGLSTHSLIEAQSADAMADVLDYFAVGPVFATQTKPGRKPVGLSLVEKVALMKPKLPWFAIGGINSNTLESVAKAGAERIVVVSDVLVKPDSAEAVRSLTRDFLNLKGASA